MRRPVSIHIALPPSSQFETYPFFHSMYGRGGATQMITMAIVCAVDREVRGQYGGRAVVEERMSGSIKEVQHRYVAYPLLHIPSLTFIRIRFPLDVLEASGPSEKNINITPFASA
jgi:hypothetical protein